MDEDYAIAFELISAAGSAKSDALMAMRCARSGDFSQAAELLQDAAIRISEAHQIQTRLIRQEASGEAVPVNIILIHAQDHLTAAMLTKELAEELVAMHEKIAAFSSTTSVPS